MAIDDEQIIENNPPEEEEEEEEEDEEDLEDPRDAIVEACQNGHHCESLKAVLDTCTERVNSKSKTEETCTQELFDFMHCVDHCSSEKIFAKVK
ncbi:cytochrome b-c1 complex subunit 6, mitochondrial-like [Amphiura filiformis]|uniref:cytochrome b-c1 complex subunit 6, mitochondrial-like n=1 Tax=Amphiura filiformis TaxID=82378 RepID=UPI003B218FB0